LKTFFCYLIFPLTLWAPQQARADAAPMLSLCEEYKSIASRLQCDQRNYLLKFGYRYCQRYVEHEDLFSTEGQQFLDRNRRCLIEELHHEQNLTCENVKRLAYRHHDKCYVEMGFCELPKSDRKLVIQEIRKRHLLRPLNLITAFKILKSCSQRRANQ
jgi:hypothetical protein